MKQTLQCLSILKAKVFITANEAQSRLTPNILPDQVSHTLPCGHISFMLFLNLQVSSHWRVATRLCPLPRTFYPRTSVSPLPTFRLCITANSRVLLWTSYPYLHLSLPSPHFLLLFLFSFSLYIHCHLIYYTFHMF